MAKELNKRNCNIVGTVYKTRRELPPSAQNTQAPLDATKVLTDEAELTMLAIYKCKPRKNTNMYILNFFDNLVVTDITKNKKPVFFKNKMQRGRY